MTMAEPATATPAYEALPGVLMATPSFSVKYTGSSRTQTTYRGKPPNPGGRRDLNTANDRSRVGWALTFPAGLTLPACATTGDPCAAVTGVAGADGTTSAWGEIDHRHTDGLYEQLDSSARCRVKARGVPKTALDARIGVVRDAASDAWIVTAYHPAGQALLLLPEACRNPVDGIDRILGNYFAPGFSFALGYGADRWFTSAPVAIPDATWRSSSRIRLRLGLTAAGRPPRDCAPRFTYERCRTSGDWSGVLTFTARSPAS